MRENEAKKSVQALMISKRKVSLRSYDRKRKNDLTFRLYQRKENESSEEDRVIRSFGNGGVNSGKSSFRHNLAQGICSFRAEFDVSWSWHWVAHFLEWGVNSCVPQRKDWISSSRVTWVNFRFLVEILHIPFLVDQSTCPLSLGSSNCKIWTWTIAFELWLDWRSARTLLL